MLWNPSAKSITIVELAVILLLVVNFKVWFAFTPGSESLKVSETEFSFAAKTEFPKTRTNVNNIDKIFVIFAIFS